MTKFKVGEVVEFQKMPELKYRVGDNREDDDFIFLTSLLTGNDYEISLEHLEKILEELTELGCLVPCSEAKSDDVEPRISSKWSDEREARITKQADENMKNHKLKVLHETEVFRQYRYGQEGTVNMQFDLIFFPGSMLVQGDMGEFWWQRTHDMRSWAYGASRSLGYFSEKLVGGIRAKEFSSEMAKEFIEFTHAERLEELVFESMTTDLRKSTTYPYSSKLSSKYEKLSEEFEELMSATNDGENGFYSKLYETEWHDDIPDCFEVYTHHFLWVRRGVQLVLEELNRRDEGKEEVVKTN